MKISRPPNCILHQSVIQKLARQVMKSGEGAAIGKAGTAAVPARVRRSSRIMKNSL